MDVNNESHNMHNHGIVIDKKETRVQCNYCDKVMSGFSRLKYHLGGVRGDVFPCEKVPCNLRSVMRDLILEKKQQKMSREAVNLFHSSVTPERNLGSKLDSSLTPERNLSSPMSKHELDWVSCSPSTSLGKRRKVVDRHSDEAKTGSGTGCPVIDEEIPAMSKHELDWVYCSSSTSLGKRRKVVDRHSDEAKTGSGTGCPIIDEEIPTGCELEGSAKHLLRCIGRFYYDSGIDLGAFSSPYFRNMIEAAISHGQGYKIPCYEELKGWLLQEEMLEVQEHVEMVKQSWEWTGCSILLDSWTSEKGKTLVSVLVDSLKGTIFLKSIDASDSVGDVHKLFLLYDRVIQEVGVDNVVQVITHDTSSTMEAVGKRISEKHRMLFWNRCALHCIGLILENIGKTNQVTESLGEAQTITRFIYGHKAILKLMKDYTGGKDIIRRSKFQTVTPFVTLEAIVSQKENLEIMFGSSTWNNSVWASKVEGKKVAQLVQEHLFWARVTDVLNATMPLVCFMQQLNDGDKPAMGNVYETMDQAKESIKKNFKNLKEKYLPFWKVIDEVWDNQLHSALHSAGYFLNPSLCYSSNFFTDAEVSSGLMCCILRMAKDITVQNHVFLQLEDYRGCRGGFNKPIAVEQIRRIHPGLWWSSYADHSPQLQRLAVRILNQTCTGSLKFNLKRSLLEKLHSKTNGIEDERLSDLVFVHYNLQLRSRKYQFVTDEIDLKDEWVRQTPKVVPYDIEDDRRNTDTAK